MAWLCLNRGGHMSVADEIEKLDALRKQGAITDKDFEKQKILLLSGKPKKKRLWLKIPLAIFGVLLMIGGLGKISGHRASGILPACDSSEAREAIENALEHNPNGTPLKLLDLHSIEDVDTNQNQRACNAIFTLNSGTDRLGYILSLSSTGNLLVQIVPRPIFKGEGQVH